jgi:hypothetical protein
MYKIYSHPSGQGNPRQSKKQQQQEQSSSRSKVLEDDKKLEVAVDHVLIDHQVNLPNKKQYSPLRVTHRDSYSTISTDPGFPHYNFCHVVVDERQGGFIPLEINFRAADADFHSFPPMPLLQKSKDQRLPDSRSVFDFYGDDDDKNWDQDIVFVPVDAEAASVSSSLEVVRNICSRYIKSDDLDKLRSNAFVRDFAFDVPPTITAQQEVPSPSCNTAASSDTTNGILSTRRARPSLPRRAPSKGLDVARPAPPMRQRMHELSFYMGRIEI